MPKWTCTLDAEEEMDIVIKEETIFRCGNCGAPAMGYGETKEGVFQTLCEECGEWTEHDQGDESVN